MADHKFALTDGNAMKLAGDRAGASSEDIHARLHQLISDMEEDHKAVSGATLPAFRQARSELNNAINSLMRWAGLQSIDLAEGHQDAGVTDDEAASHYVKATGHAPLPKIG
jgi:hypothetical protein